MPPTGERAGASGHRTIALAGSQTLLRRLFPPGVVAPEKLLRRRAPLLGRDSKRYRKKDRESAPVVGRDGCAPRLMRARA